MWFFICQQALQKSSRLPLMGMRTYNCSQLSVVLHQYRSNPTRSSPFYTEMLEELSGLFNATSFNADLRITGNVTTPFFSALFRFLELGMAMLIYWIKRVIDNHYLLVPPPSLEDSFSIQHPRLFTAHRLALFRLLSWRFTWNLVCNASRWTAQCTSPYQASYAGWHLRVQQDTVVHYTLMTTLKSRKPGLPFSHMLGAWYKLIPR